MAGPAAIESGPIFERASKTSRRTSGCCGRSAWRSRARWPCCGRVGERSRVQLVDELPQPQPDLVATGLVTLDRHDGRPPVEARYPNISLVDSPAVHSFDTPPALARYMVPVQTPMVGGASSRTTPSEVVKKADW